MFKFNHFKTLGFLFTCSLSGCGSITGLENAQSDFACSLEMPAQCASISEVYENSHREKFNKGSNNEEKVAPQKPSNGIKERIVLRGQTQEKIDSQTALLSPKRFPEEILTVWIAPFVDEEGDLHGEQRIFATVRRAAWHSDSLVSPKAHEGELLTPLNDKRKASFMKDQ